MIRAKGTTVNTMRTISPIVSAISTPSESMFARCKDTLTGARYTPGSLLAELEWILVNVLFVCLGNICRSPISQGVFEDLLRREGLENEVSADSAGTGAWHIGEPPDARAQKSASDRGFDLSDQRARRVTLEDCRTFDYVIPMDEDNYESVAALCRQSKAEVKLFLEYASDSPEREVPDPYFGGPDGFEHVLDLIEEAAAGLLEDIRKRHLESRV